MLDKQTGKAYIAAFTYSFIIGFSFLFLKLTLTVADPIDTLAHRFTASFIAILIPVIFGWIKLTIQLKDIIRILPLALFYPTMFFAFQIFGLVYTTSSEAGIVQATIPIFTLILATIFLKEKTTIWQKLSIILSVSGVIYIFIMKGTALNVANLKGTLLLLISAFSFAGYSVLARPLTKKFTPTDLTFMMMTIAFLTFNSISLMKNGFNGSLHLYIKPLLSPMFVIAILYLGVLSSLVTALLSNYVLSKIEASKMSVFGNLSTLVSIIAGAVFLHEQLYYYHIIGASMIILGVIGTNFLSTGMKKKTAV
ncbi:EamA family transporter [Bacillus aquiflavi]|uniref:EamA family transporter n=1 Tax=Bacillus aquiflavi TaxID=2672567 RepID=A0A6B3VV34_9BACI|nr:DMT family transporter [Bacillus aquiflavi]MBA4537874.1 EamA family transporter [Bacillus aquiflavi]NEY82130.1 EamA family transporter [Bacillus aquiflavi]